MSLQKEKQAQVESDDDDLQDMMDVDFPGGGSSEEDEDEGRASESFAQAPLIDIDTNGWDDDAITRCWGITLSQYDEKVEKDAPIIFEAKPNRKINENNHAINISQQSIDEQDNNGGAKQGNGQATEKSQDNKSETKWKPGDLALPEWARLDAIDSVSHVAAP
uniref:Uncharacterized protein n=1 Tax=Chaetoceros debilis TaxID=122233 RepID=A0A7S3VG63_9STRA